ncbi:M23 family metallopeptidase [Sphingomonas lenta]|uniref:Peptidase M23 n=1 Tax=Sphingomonas lenta TaxID=1141887 RepID=A0A2A2SJA5_9SPHN|nr:M23 family metallopeptidase [Sphingomonas lenta]PAX09309.1 peptidase M23 [Sphingomonas lenta]
MLARLGLAAGGAVALASAALLATGVVRISVEPEPVAPRVRQLAVTPAPAPPDTGRMGVPVQGVARGTLLDTWGQSRAGGARTHEAIDIMAPGGTPVLAAAPGTVEKLFNSRAGGITLYVRSPDRRTSYYYAHLRGYAPGMREGLTVRRGQLLGFVGDTGNSGAGNNHLHFGVSRMADGDRWYGGEPVNPYPLLAEPKDRR